MRNRLSGRKIEITYLRRRVSIPTHKLKSNQSINNQEIFNHLKNLKTSKKHPKNLKTSKKQPK